MKEVKIREFIKEQIKSILSERFGSNRLASLVNGMSKYEKSAFLKAGVKTGLDWNALNDNDLTITKKTPQQLYGKPGIHLIIAAQDFDFKEGGAYGWTRTIKKGQMIGMMIGGKVAYVTKNGLGQKSTYSSSDKVGMDMMGARSVKGMSEMPHVVFTINYLDKMHTLKTKQKKRVNLKFGATAFKSAKEFKDENLQRYKKALEQSADRGDKVHKLVLAAVKRSNEVVTKALSEMQTDRYGNIGVEVNGKVIELTYVTKKQNEILDAYSRYTNADNLTKNNGYSTDYYENQRAEYALVVKKKVKQMMSGKYDAW